MPFHFTSGDCLREWMGVTREVFYDPQWIAILPMGLCFPGRGKSGDLPPRPRCAAAWREALLDQLRDIRLTRVVGRYALAFHLDDGTVSVTTRVRAWRSCRPEYIPLPHPIPRNSLWLSRYPWFAAELLLMLRQRVTEAHER